MLCATAEICAVHSSYAGQLKFILNAFLNTYTKDLYFVQHSYMLNEFAQQSENHSLTSMLI